jgi:ribonuclease HI
MLLWSLWKSRNTKLWETMDTSSTFICSRAKDTLQEWSCMQRAKDQRFNTEQSTSWVKPPMGRIKCNVDAALFSNNTMMGYGMCFRDFFGQLLYGKSGYLLSSATVLEAETIALLESINVAISNGWNNVLFETDCKTLVEALYSPIVPTNEFGDLVSCCRSLLASNSDFAVSFIRRQANKVAHTIARASLSHTSPHIFYDVPSTMYSLFMNEMH